MLLLLLLLLPLVPFPVPGPGPNSAPVSKFGRKVVKQLGIVPGLVRYTDADKCDKNFCVLERREKHKRFLARFFLHNRGRDDAAAPGTFITLDQHVQSIVV